MSKLIRGFVIGLLGIAPLALTVGCANDKQVIDQANSSHEGLEPAIITDPALVDYVQRVGDRVVQAARAEYQDGFMKDRVSKENPDWMFTDVKFHLVNSDTLNAFTTGGTHVYLYSQLFTTAQTEDEFAAVVSHEFGHIYGRHVQKGTDRQYGIVGAAVGAGVLGYAVGGDKKEELASMLGGGAMVAGQLYGLNFSRKDEKEADDIGFVFYTRAGWDPAKFPDFFKQMIKLGYETPSGQEMTSNHPTLGSRVQDIEGREQQLGSDTTQWRQPNIVSQRDFDALRDRAKVVGASMPNDKSLEAAKLMLASFPSCVAPVDQKSQVDARNTIQAIVEKQVADDKAKK